MKKTVVRSKSTSLEKPGLAARLRSLARSLAADYFWFIVILSLYVFVSLIAVMSGPVVWQGELDVRADSGASMTAPELESLLRSSGIREEGLDVSVVPAPDQRWTILWEVMGRRFSSDISRIDAQVRPILRANDFDQLSGSRYSSEPTGTKSYALAVWLPLTILILAFFYWQLSYRKTISPSSISGKSLRVFVLAAGIGSALAIAVAVLNGLFSGGIVREVEEQAVFSSQAWLVLVFLIPLAEEIIFRGWLLERLNRVLGPALAILISTVAFSAIHPMGLVENLLLLLPGLAWAGLWLKYRSIWLCTLSHGCYNAMGLLLLSNFRM